jgi:hypothetical protein
VTSEDRRKLANLLDEGALLCEGVATDSASPSVIDALQST